MTKPKNLPDNFNTWDYAIEDYYDAMAKDEKCILVYTTVDECFEIVPESILIEYGLLPYEIVIIDLDGLYMYVGEG